METVEIQKLLIHLNKWITLDVEYFMDIKKQGGCFAGVLLDEIMERGRDDLIQFWESLYILQNEDDAHPNLLSLLGELSQGGCSMEQILLDKEGYPMIPSLKGVWETHKQYLLQITEKLEEKQPPGTNMDNQSYSITERFVDLMVTARQNMKRSKEELEKMGGVQEYHMQKKQGGLERIAPNRLFRWCHRYGRVPRTVLVSGVPGIGKTTFMQKFVFDWVNGKLYQRFSFVFFFKFRKLNHLSEVSLEELICTEYPHMESHLKTILKSPERLLFIFDGLDESKHNLDFTSNELCSNTQCKRNLSVIVTSVIQQTLVSGCSVLVTSRPTHLASIETGVFQRITEIMGFCSGDRKKYFEQFFSPYLDLSDRVFKYVQENDALYTFCYIPSYCWIICTVLSIYFKPQPTNHTPLQSLPKTITQLFVTYVANMLSNHSIDTAGAKELLASLGGLAEYHLKNQKTLVFEERDIQNFKIDTSSPLLSSFIIESREESKTTFSFLHLTIQEFFTALVQYLTYRPDNMELILQKARNFEDGYGQMVLPFLCGLSDSSTWSSLKCFLKELPTEPSKKVITWLQTLVPIITKRGKDAEDKMKCMTVLSYFSESRNKALVHKCLGSNSTLEFSEFYLTPLHCTVLGFILESCKGAEYLDLDSCYIHSEGLKRLAPFLHMVKDIRLSKNDLKDEDAEVLRYVLTKPNCRIQKLILRNNGFTDKLCSTLAHAIRSSPSLRLLDVSRNNLAGPGLKDLVTTVSAPSCQIEHLMLQQGKLTDNYAKDLLRLSENPNLKKLDLSLNFFTDRSAGIIRELMQKSPHMEEIKINTNDFSEQIEQSLSRLKIPK
ncbi:NACHT, LRR and PYD domains-containing protein 12-like isoform X2 [Hyperolius riggenbachi]